MGLTFEESGPSRSTYRLSNVRRTDVKRLRSQYPQYRLLVVSGDHVVARMIHTKERGGLLNFLQRAEHYG